MTTTYPPGRSLVSEFMPDEAVHRRQLARAVNQAMVGHTNTSMFVTLTASAATTLITDARISIQTCVILMPQTADAAAALATTYVTCAKGVATINHANNTQTDRTFTVAIQG